MSLAQHVTQDEGFDYTGPANPALHHNGDQNGSSGGGGLHVPQGAFGDEDKLPEWRRMSFAPADFTQDISHHAAAYKVSAAKRCAQVATAVVACWLASGIVFGFAALKPVLIAEGVYRDLCDDGDAAGLFSGGISYIPCDVQDMRLNLIFIVASITTNISCLFAGAALDRFGRRICWLASCLFLATGSFLMAVSFDIRGFDGYLVGNMFLGLGGTFVFVPSFQLANAFPKHSGLIVALITGAFDASAAVFLFYRMAYEASDGSFSPDTFFFGYLLVPVLIFAIEFLIMPSHAYHTTPELEAKIERAQDKTLDRHASDGDISDNSELTRVRSARADKRRAKLDQIEGITGNFDQRDARVKVEEKRQEVSGVWGVLHGVPAHKQMLTPWYILILLLTVFQMLRMNYFIATIRSQYRYMLGSDQAGERINHFFDAALPIGGAVSTPFIGLLLNNVSVPTTFGVLTVLIVVLGALNCIPTLGTGYATVVVFVIFRPLYYSVISDYATKVFGFATFGRIYGTLVCISGLVNFAQSGLDALTHGPLHGDPTPVNILFAAAGAILGLALTVFVAVRGRSFVQEKTEMEAGEEEEGRRLLSSENGGYGTGNENAMS